MAVGDATVAADHGREEQHDQHPPDNLKLDHGGLPPTIPYSGRVGSSRPFNGT